MADIRQASLEANNAKTKAADQPAFAQAGQTTQMVIDATPAPDADILAKASELCGSHKLRRVIIQRSAPYRMQPLIFR